MITQYIPQTMVTTLQKILTALYEGLSRFGCGIGGIPYPYESE
jgi:hypothetical protein